MCSAPGGQKCFITCSQGTDRPLLVGVFTAMTGAAFGGHLLLELTGAPLLEELRMGRAPRKPDRWRAMVGTVAPMEGAAPGELYPLLKRFRFSGPPFWGAPPDG
ncbi:hypothetical protein NDU88_001953 [Pleurodeles waltl]|uniref:Uncharacterized protein n=1 Tax=Pleurodeles waltl TaxID=8319 RepID=A0AAV7NDZ7_PLEWA|nr:hypothetical protein NDU88_001953 [Pleurodeles waltl]